jgi:hypothetical protein
VLGTLTGIQIAAIAVLALSIEHNGWVFFHGGDQIWLTSQAWLLGHLELPPTELGYLWSVALAPIMLVTGPTYVQAIPPIVFLNVLVLGPVAILCVYGIAARIGGRLLGYWAVLLWVLAPFATIPLFVDRYQERFAEHFLPQALGLTTLSDYPSMVLVLASAFFVVRSLEPGRLTDAALAGLLLGAAAAMKPPNFLLAAGAVLAYPIARRWREGVIFGATIVPSLLVLAFWKYRGLGEIPALAMEQVRIAAGSGAVALDLDSYFELDVDHWRRQMNELREFFWSARLVQWAPIAGLLAVLRVRRGAIAGLLAGWLGAFLLVKGFSTRASIESNTFWRLLMPAWPAYLLLLASVPLLVPTLARRLGDRLRPPVAGATRARWVAVVAVVTVLVPAAAFAAASPTDDPARGVFQYDVENFIFTSVDDGIELTATRTESGVELDWTTGGPWRGEVFYHVFRGDVPEPDRDWDCERSDGATAYYCYLRSVSIGKTRGTTFVDTAPPPGGATYRIGVATNWLNDEQEGDIYAFSPPVSVGPR